MHEVRVSIQHLVLSTRKGPPKLTKIDIGWAQSDLDASEMGCVSYAYRETKHDSLVVKTVV